MTPPAARSATPLRVAFDMRLAGYRAGGIARYATDLVAALDDRSDIDLLPIRSVKDSTRDSAAVRLRTPPHHRLERVALPVELTLRRVSPDVYHAVDLIAPLLPRVPIVATIYDLAFMRWPEDLAPDGLAYYQQLPKALRWTTEVIATSTWTANDIAERLGFDPARITVIPLGLTRGIADDPPLPRSARGDFVLAVGTVEPRKRYDLLLDMLEHLDPAIRLVIVGNPGWRTDELQQRLRQAEASGRVEWRTGLPDTDVWHLYRTALAVALPSRVEGFGLAALEGMACGTPVVSSAGGALPEVTGGAAIDLPDAEPDAWAAAIESLASDADRWSTLSAAGIAQAARFDWQSAADATVGVYRRAAGR
ncbi:MAG: glycosyltransferase family 4 protein [Thermomicrobiales bacterium]|nr:glycosyltransferase family 4 protein [Thermomicrobiales bacterium]